MRFNQAKWFTATNGRRIDGIVVHTMEYPEKGTAAEDIANFFHVGSKKASAHYTIDHDSEVQCVLDRDVAYHAPGVNHNFLGFEHSGYARQTPAEWQDSASQGVLKRSGALAGLKCLQYDIPIIWLSPNELQANRRGITSHWNVTQAFRKSTHTDPGTSFPVEQYLQFVQDGYNFFKGGRGSTSPSVHRTLREGDVGLDVSFVQGKLNLQADGNFGPQTKAAVIAFQKWVGLIADGVVGQQTWAALGT